MALRNSEKDIGLKECSQGIKPMFLIVLEAVEHLSFNLAAATKSVKTKIQVSKFKDLILFNSP